MEKQEQKSRGSLVSIAGGRFFQSPYCPDNNMSGNFFEKIATLMNVMKARVKHSATATLRGDARREDTASSLLELPGADRCPPVVRFQMIIDYIRRFDDVFMKCKQLDAVADRMARLSVERLKADVATNYEIKELRRLQKYLVLRGMDTKSTHTQTPRVPQPSAKKIVKTVRYDIRTLPVL